MDEDLALELSKVLAKTMQSSYRRKEIEEAIARITDKMERVLTPTPDDKVRELRIQFEEIRKQFYGLG